MVQLFKKKWHQTTVKIFVKKLLVAFNTNKSNLVFGLEVLACDRFVFRFILLAIFCSRKIWMNLNFGKETMVWI